MDVVVEKQHELIPFAQCEHRAQAQSGVVAERVALPPVFKEKVDQQTVFHCQCHLAFPKEYMLVFQAVHKCLQRVAPGGHWKPIVAKGEREQRARSGPVHDQISIAKACKESVRGQWIQVLT